MTRNETILRFLSTTLEYVLLAGFVEDHYLYQSGVVRYEAHTPRNAPFGLARSTGQSFNVSASQAAPRCG